MYFLRATKPSTISSICGCSSGSPPGMETMGAPHSSTALKHCFGGEVLLEDVGGVLDLAASGAGQVAAEERLQHQHQRILLASGKLLPQHVAARRSTFEKRVLAF